MISFQNPPCTNGQENFLLNENEMSGFELKRQSKIHWLVGKDQIHYGIGQKWHVTGLEKNRNIHIEYCEFITEVDALYSTAFASRSNVSQYLWGSHVGSFIGDDSWVGINHKSKIASAVYFVRGNVGVKIFIPFFLENQIQVIESLSSKLINTINQNLSPAVLSLEQNEKENQILQEEYQRITNPVLNLDVMDGYTHYKTWDSKWISDSDKLLIGRRNEWKNDNGAIIAIDICKFDSPSIAKKAVEIKSRNNSQFTRIFNLKEPASLKTIITEWQNTKKNVLKRRMFSVLCTDDSSVILIYYYNPAGIETEVIETIVDRLSL